MVKVALATTDAEILHCYPVMLELRTTLSQDEFVARINAQQKLGYRLAYMESASSVVSVAGFRLGENLAWGRFLYVDDLVTLDAQRSKGFGTAMLDWLKVYAKENRCTQLHLDSGLQRKEAHRFYEREGLKMASYHFVAMLPD